MRLEQFLAGRLAKSGKGTRQVSRPAVVIAEAGVALGLAVMIVTISVSLGFKHEIRSKVVGFNSHIHVSSFDSSLSYETTAIVVNDTLIDALTQLSGVHHVQRYATKPAIFRTDDEFLGFVLKGVGEEYDLSFFRTYLQEGTVDSVATGRDALLISRSMADKLGYRVGDRVDCYFIGSSLRARRFTVCGIYETGFGDFDKLFAVSNLSVVQRLNEWENDEVTGLEVSLNDYNQLTACAWEVGSYLDTYGKEHHEGYYVQTIEEQNPNLFAWLGVLDMNVWIILLLMLLVAGFTVISGLLILILERTQFIGILKALGSPNISIRKTFLHLSLYIIGRGMLWGNIIGLALCAVQKYTGIVALDPKNYYLDRVPIEFNWGYLVLLNVGMLVLSVAMLIIPSQIISRIYPSKSIRFE
ncbi:MAG: ABC transporter permease [Bacteroidaceae bacterium]|nr:ABC transporter permease [Bacteroidaceae bacterium]